MNLLNIKKFDFDKNKGGNMKKKIFIFTVLIGVIIYGISIFAEDNLVNTVETKIKSLTDSFTCEKHTDANFKEGYSALMDAMTLTLKVSNFQAELKDNISKAQELFQKSLFNPQAIQLLKETYRKINNGNDFQQPEDVKSIKEAQDYCFKWLNKSLENLKNEKPGEAFKCMLNTAIFIVTPIEKHEE